MHSQPHRELLLDGAVRERGGAHAVLVAEREPLDARHAEGRRIHARPNVHVEPDRIRPSVVHAGAASHRELHHLGGVLGDARVRLRVGLGEARVRRQPKVLRR